MRLLSFATLALLSAAVLGAKDTPNAIYNKYAKKQTSSTPINLDVKSYNELTQGPRDYTVAVLLTALDAKYACGVCKEFDPEWKTIARSWQSADKKGKHRVILGTLDFDRGRDVFMQVSSTPFGRERGLTVQMQLQTAPVLMVFPPSTGPNAVPDASGKKLDFLGPQSAEAVYTWMLRQLPADDYPALVRPINYGKIVTTVTIFIGLFTFGTVAYPYLLPIVQNRNLWAAISLMLVLLFTSGHMYNHIRKVPYVTGNGKGGITYFAPGFGNQFGMETQIIAAMYAILSFALISLALKVPRMKDPRAQQVSCIIWISVLFGMYSFLMSVFRVKNGGYPFWIPPF